MATFCARSKDSHHNDLVCTPVGRCPPTCDYCGLQVTLAQHMRGHEHKNIQLCQTLKARKLKQRADRESIDATRSKFTAYGDELEHAEVVKYLRCLISFDDTDTQAMRSNPQKARGSWARVSKVLRADNASPLGCPRICGLFYKATVQRPSFYMGVGYGYGSLHPPRRCGA